MEREGKGGERNEVQGQQGLASLDENGSVGRLQPHARPLHGAKTNAFCLYEDNIEDDVLTD